VFECSEFTGWNKLPHRVLSRNVRVCYIYLKALNLTSDPANLDLNRIEVLFRALLRILPNQEHSRE
jgi:hypothetical protein